MILRDIPLQPRESEHFFEAAWVTLKDGSALFIQHATERQGRLAGLWFIFHSKKRGNYVDVINNRYDMDEFEAQCVLDHYVQTIGIAPCNHQTLEPASHPTK
ncbi:hypothetical protein [Bradyrhizobium cenepequi]